MRHFQNTTYWHQNVNNSRLNKSPIPKSTDFVIIGAGFTGLATALHLLRAGKSVVLFDAMKIGDGASGKNGGNEKRYR
jgi:glycerol-3-phosphate dehydrogenase